MIHTCDIMLTDIYACAPSLAKNEHCEINIIF